MTALAPGEDCRQRCEALLWLALRGALLPALGIKASGTRARLRVFRVLRLREGVVSLTGRSRWYITMAGCMILREWLEQGKRCDGQTLTPAHRAVLRPLLGAALFYYERQISKQKAGA